MAEEEEGETVLAALALLGLLGQVALRQNSVLD